MKNATAKHFWITIRAMSVLLVFMMGVVMLGACASFDAATAEAVSFLSNDKPKSERLDVDDYIEVNDKVYTPHLFVESAKRIAANGSVGYSFENNHLDPDVMCHSFTYYALVNSRVPAVSAKNLEKAALELGYEPEDAVTGLRKQSEILEHVGFEKHEFVGFDDPNLVEGAVMYAASAKGNYKHVEIYMGRYNADALDENGNPTPDPENGVPVTIGAKNPDHDPEKGDQSQTVEGCWWEGEVSAYYANDRGDDYWTYYYVYSK